MTRSPEPAKPRCRLLYPGIEALPPEAVDLLSQGRVAMISHAAAVTSTGQSSADMINRKFPGCLKIIMSPEHGFFGLSGPGENVRGHRMPVSGIPVHSLYGNSRKPNRNLLRKTSVIFFDLQDIGARPYTYMSTMRYAMEAAAGADIPFVVADRPIPLPSSIDGPDLDPLFESFVGMIPAPMIHGMTPAETALWLKDKLGLKLHLVTAPMRNYGREPQRDHSWPPWIPPSPAIRSWESAACYSSMVFSEALPCIDCGRNSMLPFQVFGAPWLKIPGILEILSSIELPGVAFFPHSFLSGPYYDSRKLDGIRICPTDWRRFKPVLTAVSIIWAASKIHGIARIWRSPGTRHDFFDKLFGTDTTRKQLLDLEHPANIAKDWANQNRKFRAGRRKHLIYPDK